MAVTNTGIANRIRVFFPFVKCDSSWSKTNLIELSLHLERWLPKYSGLYLITFFRLSPWKFIAFSVATSFRLLSIKFTFRPLWKRSLWRSKNIFSSRWTSKFIKKLPPWIQTCIGLSLSQPTKTPPERWKRSKASPTPTLSFLKFQIFKKQTDSPENQIIRQ